MATLTPEQTVLPITIIGCGATGSRLACELARFGFSNFIIYDADIVEEHNVKNQAFRLEHVGRSKAECCAELISEVNASANVVTKNEFVTTESARRIKGIVALMVDSFKARHEIAIGLRYRSEVTLIVDPRMAVSFGKIYAFKPSNAGQYAKWEATIEEDGEDDPAELTPCGTKISVGATACFLAGLTAWTIINRLVYPEENQGFAASEFLLAVSPTIWNITE